jgi:hypothetical protein
LSIDPLTQSYPWYTPYQFAGNKPIVAIDLDGLEEFMATQASLAKQKALFEIQSAKNGQPTIGPATPSKPPMNVVIHRFFSAPPLTARMFFGPGVIAGQAVYGLINDFKIVGSMVRNGHSETTNMIGERVSLEQQQASGLNVGVSLLAPAMEAATAERISLAPGEQGKIGEAIYGSNLNDISTNFKTFDNFDPTTGTATSAKTMDLTGSSYTTTSKVNYQLSKYINEVSKFTIERKNGFRLDASMINTRQLGVTFIGDASGAQAAGIKAASNYAASKQVQFFTSTFNHVSTRGTGFLLCVPTNLKNTNPPKP